MTELHFRNTEDCINHIKSIKEMYRENTPSEVALSDAINAIEEIQQYRELERKLNGVDLTMLVNHWMEMAADDEIQGYQRGRILTNEDADKWDAYLAIGTPEELKQLKENGAFTGMELAQIAIGQMKLKEYMAIGTPDECREAVEKQKAKKPEKAGVEGYRFTDTYRCPECGGNFSGTGIADYCYHCGQKLDWSDEE